MAEVMQALQQRLEAAFLGERFFIIGLIGAIMLGVTTIQCPDYFWQYNIPALLVLASTILWGLWRNMPKSIKYLLSCVTLVMFVWLLYNSMAVQYGLPAAQWPISIQALETLFATDMLLALEGAVYMIIALVTGLVASLLFLICGLAGIMSAGRSE